MASAGDRPGRAEKVDGRDRMVAPDGAQDGPHEGEECRHISATALGVGRTSVARGAG